jgi:hypothetical protein
MADHESTPVRPVVVALVQSVVGRSLTLPAGARLIATHQDQDGRWWVVFNGSTFRAVAHPVTADQDKTR